MKSFVAILLLSATCTTVSFGFGSCSSEVPLAKEKIAENKEIALQVLSEMKEVDAELDRTIELLDAMLKSAGMQGVGFDMSSYMPAQTVNDSSSVMTAEGLIARARLNYLKASIARLQFQFSEDVDKDLENFDEALSNSKKKKGGK